MAAMGVVDPRSTKLIRPQAGVYWHERTMNDLFFITLDKSEKEYSPTTMYDDYPISQTLFHYRLLDIKELLGKIERGEFAGLGRSSTGSDDAVTTVGELSGQFETNPAVRAGDQHVSCHGDTSRLREPFARRCAGERAQPSV